MSSLHNISRRHQVPLNHNIFEYCLTIDNVFVDGISLTHGQDPRKHISTFAAAAHKLSSSVHAICPCTNRHNNFKIPPYVGNDYFCDTGSSDQVGCIFYPDDPLWDGQGCGPNDDCCSINCPRGSLNNSTHPPQMALC